MSDLPRYTNATRFTFNIARGWIKSGCGNPCEARTVETACGWGVALTFSANVNGSMEGSTLLNWGMTRAEAKRSASYFRGIMTRAANAVLGAA